MALEYLPQGWGVADIYRFQAGARMVQRILQRIGIGSVGQRIHVDDRYVCLAHQLANEGRTNEAGPAGDEDAGETSLS